MFPQKKSQSILIHCFTLSYKIIKWVRNLVRGYLSICIKFKYYFLLSIASLNLSKKKTFSDKISNCFSFISIYAQFKSVIRPQFKLILIIHSNGLSSEQEREEVVRSKAKAKESRATFEDSFGEKAKKKRNYKFFLWQRTTNLWYF